MAAVYANDIGLEVCDVDAEDWTTGCVADDLRNSVLPRRPAAGRRHCGVQLTQCWLVIHRQDHFTRLHAPHRTVTITVTINGSIANE